MYITSKNIHTGHCCFIFSRRSLCFDCFHAFAGPTKVWCIRPACLGPRKFILATIFFVLRPESIEPITEDQAFLAIVSAPPPPTSPPLSPVSKMDRRQRKTEKERQLSDAKGGREWARSQTLRPQESLVLSKSFNTLWGRIEQVVSLFQSFCVSAVELPDGRGGGGGGGGAKSCDGEKAWSFQNHSILSGDG
jgi:hypothetical protein